MLDIINHTGKSLTSQQPAMRLQVVILGNGVADALVSNKSCGAVPRSVCIPPTRPLCLHDKS